LAAAIPPTRTPSSPAEPATAELLSRLLVNAAHSTDIRTPSHPDRPDGWLVQWGAQVAPDGGRGLQGVEVTEQRGLLILLTWLVFSASSVSCRRSSSAVFRAH